MKALSVPQGSLAALLSGAAVLLSGCLLTHPGGTSLAYIEVKEPSFEKVGKAIQEVFAAERYQVEEAAAQQIVFVREGTVDDRLRYARYGEGLLMRVVVTVEPFGPDTTLVRADASAHPDGSRSPIQIMRVARRPYMQLLRRVKEKAEALPARESQELAQPAERPNPRK
jgi:hypothetical protein